MYKRFLNLLLSFLLVFSNITPMLANDTVVKQEAYKIDDTNLSSLLNKLDEHKKLVGEVDFSKIPKDAKGSIFYTTEQIEVEGNKKEEEENLNLRTSKAYKYIGEDAPEGILLATNSNLPPIYEIQKTLLQAEIEAIKVVDSLSKNIEGLAQVDFSKIESVIVDENAISIKQKDSDVLTTLSTVNTSNSSYKVAVESLYKFQNEYLDLYKIGFIDGKTIVGTTNYHNKYINNEEGNFKYYSPMKTVLSLTKKDDNGEELIEYYLFNPSFKYTKDVFKSLNLLYFDLDRISKKFKTLYNCEIDITKSEENFDSKYLSEWRDTEGKLLLEILNILKHVSQYDSSFGSYEQLNTYIEQLNTYIINVNNKYNTTIPLLTSGEDTPIISDINDFTNYGMVRDLFVADDDNNKFITSDVYDELIAFTSTFIPFETNVYDVSGQSEALSRKAQATWNAYSKYRQPLAVTLDVNNGYEPLLTASPRKLQYLTLNEYINRILKGQDIFIFINTLTGEEIKNSSSGAIKITNNIQVDSQEPTTTQEPSPASETDTASDETTTSSNTVINQQQIDNSWITSNPRFFGPVYGSSPNAKVNNQVYRDLFGFAYNGEKTTVSNETLNKLLSGSLSSFNVNGIHTLEEIKEGEKSTGQKITVNIDNQVLSSFILRNTKPDSLIYNYVLMYNTLQNQTYLREHIDKDLNNLLYMDFLGNIVTESGYVVVPAITNASRYTTLDTYPTFTAMWINSYPDVNITSEGKYKLSDAEKDKYVLMFSKNSWFKAHYDNSGSSVESSDSFDGNPIYAAKSNSLSDSSDLGWYFAKVSSKGDTFNDELPIKAPRLDTPIISSDISSNDIVEITEENNKDYTHSSQGFGDYGNTNLGKYRDYDTNTKIIDMMTPANILYIRDNYGLFGWGKHNYYVYSWRSSSPTVNTKIGNNYGTAYLTKIPSTLISYEAGALTNINIDKIKYYKSIDKTVFNLDQTLSIVASLHNGSASTEVYDFNFVDYKSKLKEDSLNYLLGNLLESIYNPFIGDLENNLLTYLPTPNNLEVFNNFAPAFIRYLVLFVIIFIIIIYILSITTAQRNGMLTIKEFLKSFIACFLVCIFIVKGLPTTLDFVFQKPYNYLLTNQNLLMTLNEYENQFKLPNNIFFSPNPRTFGSSPNIVLTKLTREQALQYRELEDRPEYQQLFYYPQYDNSKQYVMGKVYIQGLYLKIDVMDLLNTTQVESVVNNDLTMEYMQTTSNGSDNLAFYIPYYHFVESLTDTVNTYSTVSSNYYTTLKYDSGYAKSTGRVSSYINSIFFIDPSNIRDYLEKTVQDQADLEIQFESQNNQEDLPYFVLDDGTEIKISNDIANAMNYIQESLGDTDDWLGLRNMLYLNDESEPTPFDLQYKPTTEEAKWYPDFSLLEDKNQLDKIIQKVNNNTKEFVMTYLTPIADTVSDEALIKIISLKASLEYNKQFNALSKGRAESEKSKTLPKPINLYPVEINGANANNDFLTKLTYMPLNSIYMSNGESIGYFLASEMELSGLLFVLIDRLLYLFRFILRYVAFILFIISLLFYFICYILDKPLYKSYIIRIIGYLFVIVLPLHLIEILLYKLESYTASIVSLNIQVLIVVAISVLLTIAQIFTVKLLYPSLRDLIVNYRNSLLENIKIGGNRSDASAMGYSPSEYRDFSDMPEEYIEPINLDNITPYQSEDTINLESVKLDEESIETATISHIPEPPEYNLSANIFMSSESNEAQHQVEDKGKNNSNHTFELGNKENNEESNEEKISPPPSVESESDNKYKTHKFELQEINLNTDIKNIKTPEERLHIEVDTPDNKVKFNKIPKIEDLEGNKNDKF